ncbi:MAG: hypothetical protein IJW45_07640, partial [Oscillospiraceae bacterium]|nr:hypothetical protein [Oscillospiraceae bacterium]
MKNCTKCGKELMDEAVLCVGCGCLVPGKSIPPSVSPELQINKERRTNWLGWPIIGLALQVLLFILIFVPGNVCGEELGNDLPPNEIIQDVFYRSLSQNAFSFNWASVTLIVSMICSAIFYARLCRSRGRLHDQIITIIAAVAECIAYIGCIPHLPVFFYRNGISVLEQPMTNFDGVRIVAYRYELGPLFYIQLFLY